MNGLEQVENIIAVASCKGGVGKSTVAVNLAYTLSQEGYKVGLFDADIYGPSLPTMVTHHTGKLIVEEETLYPVEAHGVKLMSFGYVNTANKSGDAAIMRGPIVSQLVSQLMTNTAWGQLDYLIIDMPPGTGDIQLTIAQKFAVTCAVMVTTPQKISFVDVQKGILMFDKLNIPTVAVVENMATFTCGKCDEKHRLFGNSLQTTLQNEFGIKYAFDLPLHASVARLGDEGLPLVLTKESPEINKTFEALAKSVVDEVKQLKTHEKPTILLDKGNLTVLIQDKTYHYDSKTLRGSCRCAHCENEMTGERVPQTIKADVQARETMSVGNYAVAVSWTDGHESLFSFEHLLAL